MTSTTIAPMLAVPDGARAVEFYKSAFGAVERWRIEAGAAVIAGLSVDGAEFFLAPASPPHGTYSPESVGGTTVRIELFVEDPEAVVKQAIAAGAEERDPVTEHSHRTSEGGTFRMLQGMVVDPFGHYWLIGKFVD
jgi:PhnB protein